MQLDKLDRLGDKLADHIEKKTDEAVKVKLEEGFVIPIDQFAEVAKARNEQVKQVNEATHWETEWKKAMLESETKKLELEVERAKLAQQMEIERLRMENDRLIADSRAQAEVEASEIEAQASDTRSKRDLIGRVLEFIGRVLVAILGLGTAIDQCRTIIRQEENGECVNSRSIPFWHKPRT